MFQARILSLSPFGPHFLHLQCGSQTVSSTDDGAKTQNEHVKWLVPPSPGSGEDSGGRRRGEQSMGNVQSLLGQSRRQWPGWAGPGLPTGCRVEGKKRGADWCTQRWISLLHCPPDGMGWGEGSSLSCAATPAFQVHKFLDKNHDQVRQDVLELFVRSRTRVSKHHLLLLWPCPRAPSSPSGHSPHLRNGEVP